MFMLFPLITLEATTLTQAKTLIKKYSRTVPI